MKKGLVEIVCIIDRSGSMGTIKSDAIGGFNSFLDSQKKLPGEATFTLVQFNNKYETIYENILINDVTPLTEETYKTMGTTALLDTVGYTIDSIGERLTNIPEEFRPEKVIVAILTDGEENASKNPKYNQKHLIKEKIEHQKNVYKWEFIFLAANQDAFKEGLKLGIDVKDTIQFAASKEGIRKAYGDLQGVTTRYRMTV